MKRSREVITASWPRVCVRLTDWLLLLLLMLLFWIDACARQRRSVSSGYTNRAALKTQGSAAGVCEDDKSVYMIEIRLSRSCLELYFYINYRIFSPGSVVTVVVLCLPPPPSRELLLLLITISPSLVTNPTGVRVYRISFFFFYNTDGYACCCCFF